MDIAKALATLRPGASWTVDGNTYEGITWLDTVQQMPTREEIEANLQEQVQEQQRTQYQRQRQMEYPPIGDQLDALWKGGAAAAEMLAQVQAVKNKYPKPE